MKQTTELLETGIYQEDVITERSTVGKFLENLGVSSQAKYFGVLVNGNKATMDTVVNKDDKIVVIPHIAGG
jgi:molybdopterin converting factor small subunit